MVGHSTHAQMTDEQQTPHSISTWLLQKVDPKSEVTYTSAMTAMKHGLTPKVLARFLTLGLPGGIMMGVDAASFDVTTVMASVLGKLRCSPLSPHCCSHDLNLSVIRLTMKPWIPHYINFVTTSNTCVLHEKLLQVRIVPMS